MKSLKNKRNFLNVFLLLSLAVVLSGCGSKEEIQPLPLPSAEDVGEIKEAPKESEVVDEIPGDVEYSDENMLNGVPIIGVREVKNGLYQSYLTGEWKDINIALRRPIALTMPNNKPALPHYGISRYSVMFEAAVEGRVSRILAFFEDYDDLERIGPVRSARDYFVYEAIGKAAIFCHWGLAVPYSADLINSDKVDNISEAVGGIRVSANEAFKRYSRPNYATEYTGYLLPEGYNKAVARLGYEITYPSDFAPQFTFAAENTRVEYEEYPDVTTIYPGGKSSNQSGYGVTNPYFAYNAEDGLYYRFQSGQKLIDEMNNEQLYCSNVVFQYAHGERRDDKDYLAFRVHGEGDAAKVFTNGKMIDGTWSRMGGDKTPAKFYDLAGNEIIFNQGKTWICLIWDQYAEFMELE